MEKHKIAINREMAVYLKNASNAFVKYVDALRDGYRQHNDIKIRKERHYCKVIFFNNIDRILNSIGTNKIYNIIFIDIVNFILEHNYEAHGYYDTYVALHPWMSIQDLYQYDKVKKRVNKKAKRTKGEIFQRMVKSLLIKRMIGKEI